MSHPLTPDDIFVAITGTPGNGISIIGMPHATNRQYGKEATRFTVVVVWKWLFAR